MKPIKLEIEGLHSFETNQIIDFASLTSTGMFGIFGQTGSGKSTILDAMVLALYGKVERSKTNCDFINLKSKKARVSFIFSFVEGGKTKEYQVVRTFKRRPKNPLEVEQTAEVLEVGAFGTRQVMEGSSRVDKFIINLLGMTDVEFLKCVALPQGEFSAFLKAKPNERVAIIGNIFDLNKYGEKLWEKVRAKTEGYEKEIAVLKGQLEVLGNIDKNELDLQKKQLSTLQSTIAKKEEELSIISKTEKEEREVVALGAEKEELVKKVQECEEMKGSISFKKEAFKKSKKLSENSFLIDREEKLSAKLLEEKDNLAMLEKQIKVENTRYEELALSSQRELDSLKVQIEEDIAKLERLKLLLPVEKEVTKLKKEELELKRETELNSSKIEVLNKKLASKRVDTSVLNEELSSITKEIEAIKEDLSGYEMLLGYRLLSEFNGELSSYQKFAEEKHAGAVVTLSSTIENMELLKKKEAEIKSKIKALHEKYNVKSSGKDPKMFEQIKVYYAKKAAFIDFKVQAMALIDTQVEKVKYITAIKTKREKLLADKIELDHKYKEVLEDINKLEAKKVELESQKEAAIINNGLSNIIKATKIGTECPICCSEVLQKNNVGAIDLIVIDNAIAGIVGNIDLKLDKKENIVYKTAKVMSQIELLDAELERETTHLGQIKEQTNKKFDEFFGEDVIDKEKALFEFEKSLNSSVSEIESDYKKERVLFEELSKNNIDYIKQISQNYSANEDVNAFSELMRSLSTSISDRDVELLGILSQGENISLKLEEMDKLNKKLEQKQLEKDSVNEKIMAITQEIMDIETNLARMIEADKQNLKQLDKYEAEIKEQESLIAATVSGSVLDSIATLEKDLANKKYNSQNCENLLKECKEALDEKSKSLATMKAENKAHLEEHLKIAENLTYILNEIGLQSLVEAKPFIMGEKDLRDLENSIITFETKFEHYKNRVQEIEGKLNGRVSSGEMLEQLAIQVLELQELIAKDKEDVAKLKFEIELKQSKVEQVENLNRVLEELDAKYATAKELYNAIKGKALMEYIAEEFIDDISYMASEKLLILMDGRYELKYIDKDFFVVDNFCDAALRPVATLSGGELFVVSLALALSISDAIVSKSDREVDFFFLDEGFGTLDKEYCEYIVSSLVRLANKNLTIGLISHIPELKQRIPNKLYVEKTTNGSIIKHVSDL